MFTVFFFTARSGQNGCTDLGGAQGYQEEKAAMVGAGSVITHDVPEDALAVARERQRNLEGYARRKLEGD
ncbi:hypothetical protein CSW20_00370 [Thermus scotoductus]|nr:hypothetical protein CSW20_00370 [Thermus scotoductus]